MERTRITLLEAQEDTWVEEVDRLRGLLGAPHNPSLFPPQFLKVTFPKIGGRVVLLGQPAQPAGVGFLFPRDWQGGRPVYTLRFHSLDSGFQPQPQWLAEALRGLLDAEEVVYYDPLLEQPYEGTARAVRDLEIGRPAAGEAAEVRRLQQQIWESTPDFLYPVDIHSVAFRAGTCLVARWRGRVVGFLFGFYKFGRAALPPSWERRYPSHLRIESQLLGVLPDCRGQAVGFWLKKIQAEEALREHISVLNWTVDPLQYSNAVLNLGKLRAIAFSFYPDYYPYRNVLNQVPASRLEITWLVGTERVWQGLEGRSQGHAALEGVSGIPRVNRGYWDYDLGEEAERIAIEIPARWTALQQEDLAQALRWREATDVVFRHYLGLAEGQYVINGVGQEGERRYLIAERVGPELVESYAAGRALVT